MIRRRADLVVGGGGDHNACSEDLRRHRSRRTAPAGARERDGRAGARLIALANALEGMDRATAARLAGMDRQTLRDWVHRYNAEGITGPQAITGAFAQADGRSDGVPDHPCRYRWCPRQGRSRGPAARAHALVLPISAPHRRRDRIPAGSALTPSNRTRNGLAT